MNLYQISKIPFKEKKQLVSEACLMYKKLRNITSMQITQASSISDSLRSTNLQNIKALSMFEMILELLNNDENIIIENEFIKHRDPTWYEEKWSKTTYYKIKHQAIDQFIFLLFA